MTWAYEFSEVRQIVELAGISYRQLDYWVRKGWLQPARVSAGSGIPRLWPEEEFRVAVIMGRLVTAGLDPAVAVQAARQIVASRYPTTHLAPGITITVTGDQP